MAKTPFTLGDQAARQVGEMARRFYRDYRNPAMPPPRQPVIRGGGGRDRTFVAVIYDKKQFQIEETAEDPINFAGCAPRQLPLFRGEYSWFEVEPDYDVATGAWLGQWRVKPGGRFGVAGQCDAAHELNRSNANIHHLKTRVVMHEGDPFENSTLCPSSQDISSNEEYWTSSAQVVSTQIHYWFDVCVQREDCANPYSIATSPFNDIQVG